jgi:solute carrier family 38 (sodium-coupled neutral amino acid transporter), member 11
LSSLRRASSHLFFGSRNFDCEMSDATFSPLSNSELESGVVTVTFNQLKESAKGVTIEDESASSDIPGNSSVLTASFNFINSIVGAGIIGIPYAIQRCGFVSGVIMLAYVAYLVYQSVTMLIDCGVKAKKLDFEELAEHLLGRSGYYAALVFMFLFAYGAQVAYLVVIGDTIPVVAELFLPDSIFANRNITIALMSTIIVLPLCLLKDLSSLSWTSMLSIAADIALVLIVLIAAPTASASEGIKHGEVTFLNSSIFVGIGTMSFAFVCQHNSFIVFRSLKEKTSKNWGKVAKGSIFFSFLMCSTLGIAVRIHSVLSVRIAIAAACSIS